MPQDYYCSQCLVDFFFPYIAELKKTVHLGKKKSIILLWSILDKELLYGI